MMAEPSTENPQPEIEGDETATPTPDSPNPQLELESTQGEADEEPETFPREYVQRLRDEAARYRRRATRSDEAERRLLEATVRQVAAGQLADPTDLFTFGDAEVLVDDDGWPDRDRIAAAAAALAEGKPHLAPRRPTGDIGQGATASGESVNLASMMRDRAL